MTEEKTFVKITNMMIYDEIKNFKNNNDDQHKKISKHMINTNGKVKLNRWIATTALSVSLIAITYFKFGG